MKNGRIRWLVLLTCVFAAFVLGLLAGKALGRTPLQIHVLASSPTAGGAPVNAQADPNKTQAEEKQVLNLNTATFEQLQNLPGVGAVLAERILAYREINGPFLSIADLANVPGIGVEALEAIWDHVTIGG